jgi:hypothetical protein
MNRIIKLKEKAVNAEPLHVGQGETNLTFDVTQKNFTVSEKDWAAIRGTGFFEIDVEAEAKLIPAKFEESATAGTGEAIQLPATKGSDSLPPVISKK